MKSFSFSELLPYTVFRLHSCKYTVCHVVCIQNEMKENMHSVSQFPLHPLVYGCVINIAFLSCNTDYASIICNHRSVEFN